MTDKNMVDISDKEDNLEYDKIAFDEEKSNLEKIYDYFQRTRDKAEHDIPYPDVTPYTTGNSPEEIETIQWKKIKNKPYWEKIDECDRYLKHGSLYVGHLETSVNQFYPSETRLASKCLGKDKNDKEILLANYYEEGYDEYRKMWRDPTKYEQVLLSRNITIEDKKLKSVVTVYDKSNELYSKITDEYLRRALIKKKGQLGIESIIQTIQRKQLDIMSTKKDTNLIVQGCAGSGKTMVLLHRLRYLTTNRYIENGNFLLLVPSERFKGFIGEFATECGVSKSSIKRYDEFYRELLPKTNSNEEENKSIFDESVFSADSLNEIYSTELVKDCYEYLCKVIDKSSNNLIDYCDEKIKILCKNERDKLLNKEEELLKSAKKTVEEQTASVNNLLDEQLENGSSLNNYLSFVDKIISKLNEICQRAVDKRNAEMNKYNEYVNSITEEDLLDFDSELRQLKQEIIEQEERVKNSSFFTKGANERKLKRLIELYNDKMDKARDNLAEKRQKESLVKLVNLDYINENLKIEDVRKIVNALKKLVSDYKLELKKANDSLQDVNKIIENKFAKEGAALAEFIDKTDLVEKVLKNNVNNLESCNSFLVDYIVNGSRILFELFAKYVDEKNEAEYKADLKRREEFTILTRKSQAEVENYCYQLLFNKCKKEIKERYGIKISKVYKHYWYLASYFNYIVRNKSIAKQKVKYIFIDETQDLSLAELELIYKCVGEGKPVINCFGDINQVVSKHGITDWKKLESFMGNDVEINYLQENFRNTDQVIEYCNNHLPFKMEKLGVSMEEVKEFSSVQEFCQKNRESEQTFIVKDEIAKKDLDKALSDLNCKDYNILTVKESKGLEFYEVTVCERDMTVNEKYIAYTRALNKLNIIFKLDSFFKLNDIAIIEDVEESESA